MLCEVEYVESYIYLGQRHSTTDKNQDKEIQRRTTAGWTAFANHCNIFKGNIGICLKKVMRRKWTWAGHVSRIRDNRWTLRITIWKSYERKTPSGRPAKRRRDELDDYWKGTIWQRIAQDRQIIVIFITIIEGVYFI